MGCSLFANYHFQMGVTVMGFAEDFEQFAMWIFASKYQFCRATFDFYLKYFVLLFLLLKKNTSIEIWPFLYNQKALQNIKKFLEGCSIQFHFPYCKFYNFHYAKSHTVIFLRQFFQKSYFLFSHF